MTADTELADVGTIDVVDRARTLPKTPTGIRGFDEVTEGGLPRGRATLVTGASGTGKTLFGLEFVMRGARDLGEPGVVLTFEESEDELASNVTSLGFDFDDLRARGQIACDAFHLDPTEIVTTGPFDLEPLFIRLAGAIDAVGAKRVLIDTVEVLFGALSGEAVVRAEFARLLRWLKDRGLTTVITGERGREGQLTRYGIEEYVSDCVIILDHRLYNEMATRRIRVAKYRGSNHGTNEYPFMITDRGLSVMPLTSVGLAYPAPTEQVSLGVPRLDETLGGGVYRGSTVLVTGTAGTGKSSLAAHAVAAACGRDERALYVSFEESPAQIIRNMQSIGLDLARWVEAGLLRLWCRRATSAGLESHLDDLERLIEEHRPSVVVIDSIGSLGHVGTTSEVTSIVARHIDQLKKHGITSFLTNLTPSTGIETTMFDVSSLVDTWLLLRNNESAGERNRLLSVVKSRGSAHSNQVREFLLTSRGAELLDVQVGNGGVMTGSARLEQRTREADAEAARRDDLARQRAALELHRREVDAQIELLRIGIDAQERDLEALDDEHRKQAQLRAGNEEAMLAQRDRFASPTIKEGPR